MLYINNLEFKLINKFNDDLNNIIKKHKLDKIKKLDIIELEKLNEYSIFGLRLENEMKANIKLIKKRKDYYERCYHIVYYYPYSKNKLSISCFNENEELKHHNKDTEYLEQDYLDVYKGINLSSIKNLERYDCWNDFTPEEWLDICAKSKRETHGETRVYVDGE